MTTLSFLVPNTLAGLSQWSSPGPQGKTSEEPQYMGLTGISDGAFKAESCYLPKLTLAQAGSPVPNAHSPQLAF